MLVSETYGIYDSPRVYYRNDGTVLDLTYQSGASVTSVDGELVITTSTSGEKKVNFPTGYFTNSENVCCEMEYRGGGGSQIFAISLNNSSNSSQGYVSMGASDTTMYFAIAQNGTSTVPVDLQVGDIFRFVRENGYTKVYQNGTLLKEEYRSISNYRFGFYTNNGRIQKWDNITIYEL